MKQLAPIGITTYIRVNHLKQTIEALQKNTLASHSELYIFSDAPRQGDDDAVEIMRNYLQTISGFKRVTIIERKTNSRVYNGRNGISQLLEKYGKIIYLDEDVVTASGFLQFMNDSLDFYESDKKVLSIAGYCPPINIPSEYKDDFFVLNRFNAWGFATWKEKFNPFGFEINNDEINIVLRDRKKRKEISKNGQDIIGMIKSEIKKNIDALDVKIIYYQFKHNMYTLYPRESLVLNIGHDGTGVHCGKNTKFDVNLWDKKDSFRFNKSPVLDPLIVKLNYNFRILNFKGKLYRFLKDTGLFPILKKVKDLLHL